jgi:uncharacterized protein YjgD (DUF1641 family)
LKNLHAIGFAGRRPREGPGDDGRATRIPGRRAARPTASARDRVGPGGVFRAYCVIARCRGAQSGDDLMAERPHDEAMPPKTEPGAHDALERLLDSLHKHGFLRFANDVVSANARIAETVVTSLDKTDTQNGMQNLAVLLTALSRIPPDQFSKTMFAVADALRHVGAWRAADHPHVAPGLAGVYKLLHDDEMWQALTPLIDGMKVFARGLAREAETPGTESGGGKSTGA